MAGSTGRSLTTWALAEANIARLTSVPMTCSPLAWTTGPAFGTWLPTGRSLSCRNGGWILVTPVASADGRELLTCGTRGLRRWPIREGSQAPGRLSIGPPRSLDLPIIPTRADVRVDGRAVAVAGESPGTALIVDLPSGSVRCTLGPHPGLNRAVLSADGQWAATSGWHSPSVKIWDAQTGSMIKELPLGLNISAFFSPDSRTLVTSRGDEYRSWEVGLWLPALRLPWEIQSYSRVGRVLTGQQTARHGAVSRGYPPRRRRHRADGGEAGGPPLRIVLQWLGFTPDGAKLVAISTYSRAIHVWDLREIRRNLAAMQLDWESPPYPAALNEKASRPLTVELFLGGASAVSRAAVERARSRIETYRLAVEAKPNSAAACNGLAWAYANAPEHLRDPIKSVAMAERAVKLAPREPLIRNTLGVAYYRAGRFREATDTLRENLDNKNEKYLANDLYFLAMSHYQLGEAAIARAYYMWANRATASQDELTDEEVKERADFRAEAKMLFEK